ncbi:MAG: FIST C-terminal domain-containing protein [Planctomycetes bacterium]|nr:FIST C-terminal domain-containing protein [Planctomycetota bacterium]
MDTPRFASALSTRHDLQLALREAAAALSAGLDGRTPDLLLAFVTQEHAAEFDELAARLGDLCGARVLLGVSAQSVVAGGREVESEPALALWAVACDDMVMTPFRLEAHRLSPTELEYTGLPDLSDEDPRHSSLILLGDPYSFPMADFLDGLEEHAPGLPAVGGMASGGGAAGENALFLGSRRVSSGAVGVLLSGGIELAPVLSQAYRPVGEPWVVTDGQGSLVKKLGGRPATEAMMKTLEELSTPDRLLLQNGPILGVAWNANQTDFRPSDFLAHPIRGVAPQEDAVVVVGHVRRGQTVQFMVRDAKSAGADLEHQLAAHAGPPPSDPREAGVLLFTCNGRGAHMFVEPDHDVRRVKAQLGDDVPTAGFFAMGEIGPVGGRNHLHGFTASVAVYRAARS